MFSCNGEKKAKIKTTDFSLTELNLLTNYPKDVLYMDYTGAMHGFVIPSASQTADGRLDIPEVLKEVHQRMTGSYNFV